MIWPSWKFQVGTESGFVTDYYRPKLLYDIAFILTTLNVSLLSELQEMHHVNNINTSVHSKVHYFIIWGLHNNAV